MRIKVKIATLIIHKLITVFRNYKNRELGNNCSNKIKEIQINIKNLKLVIRITLPEITVQNKTPITKNSTHSTKTFRNENRQLKLFQAKFISINSTHSQYIITIRISTKITI